MTKFVVIEVSDVYQVPKAVSLHDNKKDAKEAAWLHLRKVLLEAQDLPANATSKEIRDADATLPSKKGTEGGDCYAYDELFVYFLKVG